MSLYHQLEVNKIQDKHLICDFNIKEQEFEVQGVKIRSRQYISSLQWLQIYATVTKLTDRHSDAIKSYSKLQESTKQANLKVNNLLLSVTVKTVPTALMSFLNINSKETYDCYLCIVIEEISNADRNHFDEDLSSLFVPPVKQGQSEMYRLRNKKQKMDEYDPTFTQNSSQGAAVYIPSSAEKKRKDPHEAEPYSPQPINGASSSAITYTPTNKKNDKIKGKRILSTDTPRKLAKPSDQMSPSLTLPDSITDSNLNVNTSSSTKTLFGEESDSTDSLTELAKKYENMPSPPKKKTRKASTHRSALKSSKLKRSNSNRAQTTINSWINTGVDSVAGPSTKTKDSKERGKTRKLLEKEEVEKIVEKYRLEEDALENINAILNKKLQKSDVTYEKISLPSYSKHDLEQKFEKHKDELKILLKQRIKCGRTLKSDFYLSIGCFVNNELRMDMLEVLEQNFPNQVNNLSNFTELVLPEWAVLCLQDEYGFDRATVVERVTWQTNQLNISDSLDD